MRQPPILFYTIACTAMSCTHGAFGQEYTLASPDVLKSAAVSSVTITKHKLQPAEGWVESSPHTEGEPAVQSWSMGTFHFNAAGLPDSHTYDMQGSPFTNMRFEYDRQGRLIRYVEATETRPLYKEIKMIAKEDGWVLIVNEDGRRIRHATLNNDSVILNDSSISGLVVTLYDYDPAKELTKTAKYVDGELCAVSMKQWILKNGEPDSFYVMNDYKTSKITRHYDFRWNRKYEGKHAVHKSGSVLRFPESPYSEHLTNVHFKTRLNRYQGIRPYSLNAFRGDSIETESAVYCMPTFDGKTQRHYYTFEYR